MSVALHVGPVGLSHRNRDDVERRFQNPGRDKPVIALGASVPVLLGLWEEGSRPVVAVLDARPRVGKPTRQSLFIPLWQLEEAARTGWAEHRNVAGELILAFHPALLPSYLESIVEEAVPPPEQVAAVIYASGLNDMVPESPEQRARRAATQLVRNAAFGRDVVAAYDGLCAMCGVNFGLVEGAHIYPAHAPNSPDTTTNGLALCGNHHIAFDRHLIWIHPEERTVKFHPHVEDRKHISPASTHFITSTFERLREPQAPRHRPIPDMFLRRYAHFAEQCDWAR